MRATRRLPLLFALPWIIGCVGIQGGGVVLRTEEMSDANAPTMGEPDACCCVVGEDACCAAAEENACYAEPETDATDVTAPDPTAPATTRPAPSHPDDAVGFKGHWYKVFEGDLSWHDKKKACEAMGGYLACIESEPEQTFIAGMADGRYLSLGATDEAKEDAWGWINGAPFDYTCWMDGQPNNYGDAENYLATYDSGEWVDVDVEGNMFWMPTGYICEWER